MSVLATVKAYKQLIDKMNTPMSVRNEEFKDVGLELKEELSNILKDRNELWKVLEEQKTEFIALADANREEFLESQRMLFHEQDKTIMRNLTEIFYRLNEIDDKCEVIRNKLDEQSTLLIECCLKLANLEKSYQTLRQKIVFRDNVTQSAHDLDE